MAPVSQRAVRTVLPRGQLKRRKKWSILAKNKPRSGSVFPVVWHLKTSAAFDVMTSILSYRMMFDLRETRGLAYRLSIGSGSDGSKCLDDGGHGHRC